MRHTNSSLSGLAGGVYSYEFTYSEKFGWHPHIHMYTLFDKGTCPDFPVDGSDSDKKNSGLAQEWLGLTRDSYIVDVRAAQNSVGTLAEVLGYALKFSSMSLAQNWDAYWILRGKRMLNSLGVLRGIKEPANLLDDFEKELLNANYIQKYFRFDKENEKYDSVPFLNIPLSESFGMSVDTSSDLVDALSYEKEKKIISDFDVDVDDFSTFDELDIPY